MTYGLPLTIDMGERSRMQESARRRRMLDGVWEIDLVEAMAQYISAEQMAAWGRPDLTKNVFRSVVSQLSILYDREPIIDHPDPTAAERMRELCRGAGVWTQGPQLQRLVIGQREAFRRVSWEDGRLLVRLVPVDCTEAEAHANTPSEPHTVYEYRRRELDGADIMTRDVLSVEAGGVYRIESADGQRDLTVEFLGQEYSGDAYPYRDQDGAPVLPYVLTHALDTGRLFDAYEGRELVEGSLKVAVLWSFWSHIVFDCSHPQRYGVNARPAGLAADPRNDEHATFIATDPASLLLMEAANPDAAVALGQFAPGGDPVQVGVAIRDYSADLAMDFDLAPGDVQRSHSDARSGYAIHVVNEENAGRSLNISRNLHGLTWPCWRSSPRFTISTAASLHSPRPATLSAIRACRCLWTSGAPGSRNTARAPSLESRARCSCSPAGRHHRGPGARQAGADPARPRRVRRDLTTGDPS